MGAIDTETRKYMSNSAHFADAFNYLIFDGKPVIDPAALQPMDPAEIVIPYGNDAREPVQKYRDVLKLLQVMTDGKTIYAVLGQELQANVHYAMPVKDMLYDSMHYARQVEEAKRSYQNQDRKKNQHGKKNQDRMRLDVENQDRKTTGGENPGGEYLNGEYPIDENLGDENPGDENPGGENPRGENQRGPLTSAEFLSGFRKGDKLMPVITLVIYFGSSEWDAPMSIHEMLSTNNEQLLQFVPDYRINLIAPAQMTDEDFLKFSTDFGKVLQYIKYSKDKEKLQEIIHKDDRFRCIDEDSANLIFVTTNSKFHYETQGGQVDMCKAIDDMRNEAMEIGWNKGLNEGRNEGILETLTNLVKKDLLSLADAAREAGLSVGEFQKKTSGMSLELTSESEGRSF